MKNKLNKFKILLIVFCISIIISFNNNVFGADVQLFNKWIEENKTELSKVIYGYEYLIVNNWWENRIILYYTNVPNNKWFIQESGAVRGSRKLAISISDLGKNYFRSYCFNPNNDNTFVLPSSLSNVYANKLTIDGNNGIINNYNVSNILYNSSTVYGADETTIVAEKKTLPLQITRVEVGQVAKVEQLVTVITQVLKLIIPIGLIVLSFILVISLVRLVISRAR